MAGYKRKHITELAKEHAKEVSQSAREWMGFLSLSARMYQYPFRDSFLIHAQRPLATACTSFDSWNVNMHRRINRGAKGIALFDDRNYSGVRYVFDVADTHPDKGGKNITLWTVDDAVRERVLAFLQDEFDVAETKDINDALMQIAERESARYAEKSLGILFERMEGTQLEDFDMDRVRSMFSSLLTMSVYYSLHVRCGIHPLAKEQEQVLEDIRAFGDIRVLAVLGCTTNKIVEPILMEIGKQVTKYRQADRKKAREEKKRANEQNGEGI